MSTSASASTTAPQRAQSASTTATRLPAWPGPGRTDAGAGRPTSAGYPDTETSPAASRPRTRAYTATRAPRANRATSSARSATASATDIPVSTSGRPTAGQHRQRVDDRSLGQRQRTAARLGTEEHEGHAQRGAGEDVAPVGRATGHEPGLRAVDDPVGAPQLAPGEGQPGA